MNLNQLYRIDAMAEENVGELRVQLTLNKDHAVFTGHFPEHPVLPGVAMVQMVTDVLQKHLNVRLQLCSLQRTKFITLVNPLENDILNFTLSYRQENNLVKVKNSTTFVDQRRVMDCTMQFIVAQS